MEIELNFAVPKGYRKAFMVDTGEIAMCIEVDGTSTLHVGMRRRCEGRATRDDSMVLDWIQECIETIRQECVP